MSRWGWSSRSTEGIPAVGDEAEGGQFAGLTLADSRLEGAVELVEGLVKGEVGQRRSAHRREEAVLAEEAVPGQELLAGPVVLGGLLGDGSQALGHGGQFEACQVGLHPRMSYVTHGSPMSTGRTTAGVAPRPRA